jgi:NADH-quinone oxidoreductase subunit E
MSIEISNVQAIPGTLQEQSDFSVPEALVAEIDELITHYPVKRSASLMLLHAFQDRYGHVSRQAVEWIAARLELQPINIYELVTFYPMFHRKRVGKFHFKICRTLSCALGGSYQLHEHLCKRLGLDPHAHGPQQRMQIHEVECLNSAPRRSSCATRSVEGLPAGSDEFWGVQMSARHEEVRKIKEIAARHGLNHTNDQSARYRYTVGKRRSW